jgi:hypothetical protein
MRTLLLLALAGCASAPPAAEAPDAVYWNAVVHPVVGPRAEALAVKGGRIVAVGSNADVRALAGPGTALVDLDGACVVPGLIDAHGHLAGLGALLTGRLDLVRTKSFAEVVELVRARAKELPPGQWILGGRWDQANWGQKDYPTHELLSAAAPEHPVWLTRVDGHMGLANRKAMDLAGISLTSKSPDGGEILKGPDGGPNGLFVDRAMGMVTSRIRTAEPGFAEKVLAAQSACLKVGLTSVHDAGVAASDLPAYRALDDGRLKLRVHAMVSGHAGIPEWFARNAPSQGRRLTVRACKMFIDGAMGSRGAWMLEPYADRPDSTGLPVTPPEVLRKVVEAGVKHGWQVCTHAIGDRGNRETLDAYAAAPPSARFRIEHAQNPAVEDIPRFARQGVIASMQPTHATSDMRWAEDRVGPARAAGAYAWRKFLAAGVRIAGGSDFPVEDENPLLGLYAAVTRQDAAGRPPGGWRAEERLTREEALRAFTLDAAFAAFAEDDLGSLEPGKRADFAVFSKDLLACPPRELLAAECVLTVIDGEVVHRKP